MNAKNPWRSVLMMVGAMGCFVVNDAISKYVSQGMPSAQLIFLRGCMATSLVLLVVRALGATKRLGGVVQPRVAMRAAVDACATVLYLFSLFHLPLGTATAINLAAPLFMTVFAVVFLRERAGIARWAAVLLGFAGVLCVVRPDSQGIDGWALMCLVGALFQAARDLLTRRIDPTIPSIVVTLATSVAVALLAGALSLWQGWRPFTAGDLASLGLASAFLASAYFLLVQSMRQGDMSLTAPFRYSALLFAMLLGYVVWGDVPDTWAWIGIALLVGAGLHVVRSERGRNNPTRVLDAQPE